MPLVLPAAGYSATVAATIGTPSLVVALVTRLPAGYLSDRYDQRTLRLLCDLLRMVAQPRPPRRGRTVRHTGRPAPRPHRPGPGPLIEHGGHRDLRRAAEGRAPTRRQGDDRVPRPDRRTDRLPRPVDGEPPGRLDPVPLPPDPRTARALRPGRRREFGPHRRRTLAAVRLRPSPGPLQVPPGGGGTLPGGVRPGSHDARPYVIASLSMLCAESDDEAVPPARDEFLAHRFLEDQQGWCTAPGTRW